MVYCKCRHNVKQTSTNCNYNIELGRIGCDGMMNYQLSKSYSVINPCRDIISIHNHEQHILYTKDFIIDYQNVKYKYNGFIQMMKTKGFLLKNIPFSYIDEVKYKRKMSNMLFKF